MPTKKSNRGGLRDPAGGRPPLDPAKKRIECKFTIAPQTKQLAQEIAAKKGYKGKGRAVDEAIVLLAQKEGIIASETEAKQPIRGALLLESGWTKQDDVGSPRWYKKSINDEPYSKPCYHSEPCEPYEPYYLEVYINTNEGVLVYIAMGPEDSRLVPRIKTMADLDKLLGRLKDD